VETAIPETHLESTSNDAIISGAVDLTKYRTVIWILGRQSTKDHTFDGGEQKKVEAFIAGGGNLFVSGTDIGWDLDHEGHGRSFFNDTLKTKFVADDAKSYEVAGAAGSIFADLAKLSFDDGKLYYDAERADVISPGESAILALSYTNSAGGAATQLAGMGGRGSVVVLGFPFEVITTAADRTAVMKRVLAFFEPRK
jgi:hypothetical protein